MSEFDEIEEIVVHHQGDHGMWGPDPDALEGVDEQASYVEYARQVREALEAEYPNAEIDVFAGNVFDRVTVNGDRHHDEIQNVQAIYERIWSDWDWVVYK